jgi:hypothetical protein
MLMSASLEGAGLLPSDRAFDWAMMVNPASTFIMATYDGALGPLALVTVLLPLMPLIQVLRRRKARAEAMGA